MIEINLVPVHLRKKRKSRTKSLNRFLIPRESLLGLGGWLVVLFIALDILLQTVIVVKYVHFKNLQSQSDKIKPERDNVDRVINELRALEGKLKSVEKISIKKKILWAQKLNDISDSLPKGAWLTKIAFSNDALILEGSAIAAQKDAMINVHDFAANLKNNENFLKEFAGLELGSIQRRSIKDLEVADFTITAKIK